MTPKFYFIIGCFCGGSLTVLLAILVHIFRTEESGYTPLPVSPPPSSASSDGDLEADPDNYDENLGHYVVENYS